MVNFRKSKKIGPFRITASKGGLSVSGGVPGARVSANTKGEVRRTVGIPGTGIYDTKRIDGGTPPAAPASPLTESTETRAAPSSPRHSGSWPCIATMPNNAGRRSGQVVEWWEDPNAAGGWRGTVELSGTSIAMDLDGASIEMSA